MKTKLLSIALFLSLLCSCNSNVETYRGQEALIRFVNLQSNSNNVAIYKTSDGYFHWLFVNTLTATKYEFSGKATSDGFIDEESIPATAVMKITRNCDVEKEMVAVTKLQILMMNNHDEPPLIDF